MTRISDPLGETLFVQKKEIVLASKSPRRKGYLERYGLRFRILTGEVDETPRTDEQPVDFVGRMAGEKAGVVVGRCSEDEIVIAADTIVVFEGEILGKPGSSKAVFPMLNRLNGNTHEVVTSYVIRNCANQKTIQKTAVSQVRFNRLSEGTIRAYASTSEPLDKAGAYSIQGVGTLLVRSIEGSYNNVVGLPIEMLLQNLLEHKFIEVRDQDKSHSEIINPRQL